MTKLPRRKCFHKAGHRGPWVKEHCHQPEVSNRSTQFIPAHLTSRAPQTGARISVARGRIHREGGRLPIDPVLCHPRFALHKMGMCYTCPTTKGVTGYKVSWNHLMVCSKAFSCPSTDSGCSWAGRDANPWTVPMRGIRLDELDNDERAYRGNPRTHTEAWGSVT